ncbi:MAG: cadherin-like domain-containing protein [Alphaproteobacteria bacterium]|nr:cadherin-like domain-containing protein [Alphaproteobacteria bacterium]
MTIYNGGNGKDIINGGSGNDVIHGGNGNDTLNGGAGNDQIYGDNGSDDITGGAGDDLIDGGNGPDTAYYSGPIDEYTFFTSGGYLNIVHLGGAGADGHDRVINVERLVFADRVIDIGSGKNIPVAVDDQVYTNEDAGVVSSGPTGVLANDYDFDGDALHVTAGVFVGTYGTLTLNANGTYSYVLSAAAQALAAGENVVDSFNYRVTDNDGSDTGALVFHIAGVNDAPTANPDATSADENAIVDFDVLANDSDIDHGAVLSLIAASVPTGQGSVSIVNNHVRFDPGTDFDYLNDGDTFVVNVSYTIQDEHGAQAHSTLSITILGSDDGHILTGTDAAETLTGGNAGDTIDARGGDDTVFGLGGNDVIHGGDGADSLSGDDGNDTIDGGSGNDVIFGGDGNDSLAGGDGNDVLSDFAGTNSFTGGAGDDLILAGAGDGPQTIDAGDGNDTIQLSYRSFGSTITTGAGSDTIELLYADVGTSAVTVTDFTPGAGGDRFQLGGDDGALLSLLSGWDGDSNPFGSGFLRLVQSGADTLLQWDQDGTAGGVHWDTLAVFQNTNATAFTDANFLPGYPPDGSAPAGATITGTAAGEVLVGTAGNDTIDAQGGNDTVFAGGGADTVSGGDGVDSLNGEAGNDVIHGGNNDDQISGGAGNDQLFGDDGNDDIVGDAGNDQLSGGAGNDSLNGGAGNDSLDGGDGDDFLSDFSGTNSFAGGSGDDLIVAAAFDGSQTIDGGDGNDTIKLSYRSFASTITTGTGSDTIELLYADTGTAAVTVTDFTPGAGGDLFQLMGDDGALLSLLIGWDGSSNPFGSGFLRLEQSGADTLLQWDQDGTAGGANWATIAIFQNTDATAFTDANFVPGYPPDGGAPTGETITGTADDDILIGSVGPDTINALDGQDAVFGLAGADTIYGGDGLDNLNGGDGNDYIDGGNGDDDISGDDGNDQLFGQAGNDNIFGGNGDDQISGGDGNDNISGEAGNDVITGGNDDDVLRGGDGNDSLDGGDGNDFLSGDAGSDVLTGGAGSDVFSFTLPTTGPDQITDFASGTDRIEISASGFGGGLAEGGSVLLVSGANPTASGSLGEFLYDTDDGKLYWDDDGAGSDAPVLIATLTNLPPLAPSDIYVVA